MDEKEAQELAAAHWAWLEQILLLEMEMKQRLFIDAFLHGLGHGFEACEKQYKVGNYADRKTTSIKV